MSACYVINLIKFDSFAALFNCTTVDNNFIDWFNLL